MLILDSRGRLIDFNHEVWEAALGISAAQIKQSSFRDIIHPEYFYKTLRSLVACIKSKEKEVLENRLLCKDGTVRWFLWSSVFDDGEKLIYIIGHDITSEKKIMQELSKAKDLYRSVISVLDTGIVLQEKNGKITASNSAAERILGLPSSTMTGLSSSNPRWNLVYEDETPFPPEEHPAMVALSTGKPCTDVTMGFRKPDGEMTWVHVNSQPLFHPNQKTPYATVTSFTDITARRAIEKIKNEFISVISHELRTPLTSISGALGLLASGITGQLPEKAQQMLSIAVSNTDRLMRLVNDILDVEKIKSGTGKIVYNDVDIAMVIRNTVEAMQPLGDEAKIHFQTNVEPVRVSLDTDRITQALTNLIGNAIKFSPPKSTITISNLVRDNTVIVKVSDEGRGIPPDKLESIFDRFQQVDSSDSREKSGTGLGLAICHGIIEQHGGKIWAENTPRQGSIFYFTLPIFQDGESRKIVSQTDMEIMKDSA